MKIGFSLVYKSDVLWVRVLHSKYSWKDQILDSISRNQCSHLWRALAKIWSLFHENLIWSLGDSSTIRCWKNLLIPGMGSLFSKIPSFTNLDLNCHVREFINSDGSWNLDLFRVWLSQEVICRIISIPPPHSNSGSDRVIWVRSSSRAFSIRSAYWALKEPYWNSLDENWKSIWKYPEPQRVRFFLLLASQQKLLTNSERVRRGIGHSTSCALCGYEIEDLSHVLRDCSFAKDVWMLVLPEQLKQRFFSTTFSNWFSLNLCFHKRLHDSGLSWPCLFGLIAWHIWKNRNIFIF
ncbi:hypothetical protein V6Z11_A10G116700 [Gossypium hirsutum]